MSFFRRHVPMIALLCSLLAAGFGLGWLLVPAEQVAVAANLMGFPDSDAASHHLRPLILAGLCVLPALAGLLYALGDTLDRYITRQFLGIFGVCLSALLMIWLLVDLSDKVSDFRNCHNVAVAIVTFYISRSPSIVLLLLPYSLLLALIYCLGKLSSNREIIAMVQSGRGIFRMTRPLMIAGAFCTVFATGINYHWAPTAEGRQDEILAEASGQVATDASRVLYRSPETNRLWMIGAFPADYEKGLPLLKVEVTTTDSKRQLTSRLCADEARWDRKNRRWTFQNAVEQTFHTQGPPTFRSYGPSLVRDDWSETPWQLIKPGLSAAHLGVPDLNTWLLANERHQTFADSNPYLTQWHYRWALPFTCLVTVMLATPLSIHFSRRGPGGGVFMAVVLSALMLLLSSIVLAFGESGILAPALAAWLPNLFFATLGVYLFRHRISGKPFFRRSRRPVSP